MDIEFPGAIQNFFFLVYFSDPRREKVKIYADGDVHPLTLSWGTFTHLIESSSGSYECIPDIRDSLTTYGTPWLYTRQTNKIKKIHPVKGNIKDIGLWIKNMLASELSPEPSINPADKYAAADISSYDIPVPKMGAQNEILSPRKSGSIEITLKK